jgi:hypothetical protein
MKNFSGICSVLLFSAFCCAFALSQGMLSNASALTPAEILGTRPPSSNSADAEDVKGPVNLPGSLHSSYASQSEMQSLGNVWKVTECCGWTGTWTRRAGTNTFDAKWRHTNGTTAQDIITLQSWNKYDGKVVLKRQAINGTYTGTIDTRNRKITGGTASWYKPGDTWSATY